MPYDKAPTWILRSGTAASLSGDIWGIFVGDDVLPVPPDGDIMKLAPLSWC